MKRNKLFNGVDKDSTLFICIWLAQKGCFNFDSKNDDDFLELRNHLNLISCQYKITRLNRYNLSIK